MRIAEGADREVKAVLATDSPVRMWGPAGDYDEVLLLSGARYAEPMPLLANHDRTDLASVIGSVRGIRSRSGRMQGLLRFATDPLADLVWAKVRDGHVRSVSIGYTVDREARLNAGEGRTIGKAAYRASADRPLRVVLGWALREVSIVAVGADEGALITDHAATTGDEREKAAIFRDVLLRLAVAAADRAR